MNSNCPWRKITLKHHKNSLFFFFRQHNLEWDSAISFQTLFRPHFFLQCSPHCQAEQAITKLNKRQCLEGIPPLDRAKWECTQDFPVLMTPGIVILYFLWMRQNDSEIIFRTKSYLKGVFIPTYQYHDTHFNVFI